jgi:hypothetical protein
LPCVGHERAVHLDHERGGAPVAQLPALPVVVAAGDELVDRSEVAAAHRQLGELDAVGQSVGPAEQDLARRPEVDDGAQSELLEPFVVGPGELAERVAAEQPPADDLAPVGAPVAADVPHVHRALERHVT